MANVYKTTQTSITSTGTFVTVLTASASTTLVKAIRIVHTSGAATATLAITKSGGTQSDMGEFSLASKVLTNTITEVLPLEAGDVLKVSCTHQPTQVWVSYVENVVSVAGQSIDVLVDVDTTGKANGNVLTWDSVAGQWEAAAPAGVASVAGTAPIQSSGTANPTISITAATTSAAGSMSASDKTKLDGIATGAEVNQNAFSNVAVTGQDTVAAEGKTDTLNLEAGTGITITTNATTDTVTITNTVTAPNTFGTIEVSGQSSVVADSTTDTLTLAAANANVVITTNATNDTITFGLGADLLVDSVSTTGNLFALGNITGTNLNISDITAGDISADIVTLQTLNFTGGGTTTIGPNNALPTDPSDLEIRTNGNCDVVLDYDDNESSQAFRVKDGDGNIMFSVDEDGISVANGTSSTGAVLRLGEATANGTNYVAVQAPASLAANTTYTLPTADGTNGQMLSTNGSGTLSWATASGGGTSYSTVRTQSGTSYTLALTDAGDYIQTTSTTAVTITVPLQSSVAWAADTEIYFEQNNTGQITIAGASGVTINSSETLKSFARYSVIALKRVAENVWTLTGERALV